MTAHIDNQQLTWAWQKFEAEYKVSDNYSQASQIIFMAFEAAWKASNTEAQIEILLKAKKAIKEQIKASKNNLKYQQDNTYNERVIKSWEDIIQGEKFALVAVEAEIKRLKGAKHG